VPVAPKPPNRVEESVAEVPTIKELADRVVVKVGLALITKSGSQPLVAPLLLESPL